MATRQRSSSIDGDPRARLRWAAVDCSIWFFAVLLGAWLRYQFTWSDAMTVPLVLCGLWAAGQHLVIGAAVGPYSRGHLRGSFDEVVEVTMTTAVTAALLFVFFLVTHAWFNTPRTVPVIAFFIATTLMMSARFVLRALRARRRLTADTERRVIIFGAGRGGRLLTRNLVNDVSSPYLPVALLDDNPAMRGVRVEGVRVRGGRDQLETVAEQTGADLLVLAMPSVEGSVLRELRERASEAGLATKVVPPLHSLIGQDVTARDIRDINLEDLLGRRPITLDEKAIGHELTGRRVLVTGAGGSIGSELVRQIARFSPERLVMLDRDESALQAVQVQLAGHGLLDTDRLVLADIRDEEAMRRVFVEHRPEVVFHAAALKHLPLLERYPLEAWKSNVLGTLNVLRAAEQVGVDTFVNISTDKAADPTCVLGYSKRIAERLTADTARHASGRYMSVRFGNVLGSRGSVIPVFTEQIRRGGPLTLTDPEVERYFMLIPEACQLVMQAAVMGGRGEVMVLDMGAPVKILDLARTLIDLSGRHDVEIKFTGLRPGEKMSESLFNANDDSRPSAHPLVHRVDVPPLDGATVDGMPLTHDRASAWMRGCAREGSGPVRPVRHLETLRLAEHEGENR